MMIYSTHETAVVFHSNIVMEVPIRGEVLAKKNRHSSEVK